MTPFRLLDASSASEAATLLRAHAPHARPIAAGGDLLGLLKEGVVDSTGPAPAVLVNLATAHDLSRITRDEGHWRIGAMVTLARLAAQPELPPMLAEAIEHIASPQLRARTTLGGNLLQRPRCLHFRHPDIGCFKKGGASCTAVGGPDRAFPGALYPGRCHAGHPSDLAPVLIALDAQAEVVGGAGPRTMALQALYHDAAHNPRSETQLRGDEVLSALVVPSRTRAQAFEKVAPRAANEFAWTGAAIALDCNGERLTHACIAASGVAPGPFVFEAAHRLLKGCRIHEVAPAEVASQLVQIDEAGDVIAARAAAARLAIERALARALQRAAGGPHNARSTQSDTP